MERLTTKKCSELLVKYNNGEYRSPCFGCESINKCNPQKVTCGFYKALEKLAEYEDLEEQGKLIKLPFKIGDTVYRVIGDFIEPCTVKAIFLTGDKDENGNQQYMMALHYNRADCLFVSEEAHFSYIGKTIFLTREEAENELRRMEGTHAEEKEQPETE